MASSSRVPRWINPADGEQLDWILKYLRRALPNTPIRSLLANEQKYEVIIFERNSPTPNLGAKLFAKMSVAWRKAKQRRARSRTVEISITIREDLNTKLSETAKLTNRTKSSLIEDLASLYIEKLSDSRDKDKDKYQSSPEQLKQAKQQISKLKITIERQKYLLTKAKLELASALEQLQDTKNRNW
jgi:hypothetical protein